MQPICKDLVHHLPHSESSYHSKERCPLRDKTKLWVSEKLLRKVLAVQTVRAEYRLKRGQGSWLQS